MGISDAILEFEMLTINWRENQISCESKFFNQQSFSKVRTDFKSFQMFCTKCQMCTYGKLLELRFQKHD